MKERPKKNNEKNLVLLPLGGTGEIGMNCYCYGVGHGDNREWVMVDLGVKFGDESDPGIDVILPDVTYIAKNRKRLSGLVLTHAHEDHIGAVPWVWSQLKCPIYCTAFTAALLNYKLKEHELEDIVPVHIIPSDSCFKVGSFELEFITVTHSIPEPSALLIATPYGKVLHSGDWRMDQTPTLGPGIQEKRLRELGEQGIDVLVCDSTNILREGFSPSESEIAAELEKIITNAQGRVAVTTFASHVERVASAVKAARKTGREVILAGRAMHRTLAAAHATGYVKDISGFLDEEAFGYIPPEKALLICTGSQGEQRAALARIAEGQHPHIQLEKDDVVIFSSRTIPGNEKAVGLVQNNLARLDVAVITPDDALVHASGHPRQGEVKSLYDWLKPKSLVPMHGEARHLRFHTIFAKDNGIADALIPKDGTIMRLCPGPLAYIDEAPFGRLHVDGDLVVPSEEGPARRRRKLSFAGIVMIAVAIDERGALADDIQLITDGLPAGLDEEALEAAEQAFKNIPRPKRLNDEKVEETLRNAVRRTIDQVWGKKPLCKVQILRV